MVLCCGRCHEIIELPACRCGLTREALVELTDDPELLFADGFDQAIVGVAQRCGQPTIVVYERQRCIELLVERDKCSPEEAEEHFGYNVEGAWVGPRTPAFLSRVTPG
jgi:hypothetical protein